MATYQWLTLGSTRVQNEMGAHGIMRQFRPPFANYIFPNWPIVLNALPEIQRSLQDPILFEQAGNYAQILKDALLRYVGALEDEIEAVAKEATNPVSSFREGVNAFLRAPIFLLYWLGLRGVPSLSAGPAGRVVSGLVALIMLLSAVVSLVVGWRSFLELAGSVVPR